MAGPPSRSSFPSVPGEPRVRRLGVGPSSGADRPLRAQVIVALVCVAMLIAVPLYLLRKPALKSAAGSGAPSASGSVDPSPSAKAPVPLPAAPAAAARLTLGAVQKVRCGATPAAQTDGALCDTLAPFEDALRKAVLATEDCAPKSKTKGSINYVLTIDFQKKKLHVFPGASGDWRGKVARRACNCVREAVKVNDWNVPHQFRHYAIAVLATYAAPAGADVALPPPVRSGAPVPALPTFE
jgi:hypothetical protein